MGADVGQAGLDLGDAMRIGRHLGFGQERVALRIGLEHDLDQAFGTIRRFLREPPDAGPRRQRKLAVIERHVARNGAKQRGLADTIAPNEADARAIGNARGRAFQQQLAGHPQRHIVDHEHARYLADRAARRNGIPSRRMG
jgi:hypothetical protein